MSNYKTIKIYSQVWMAENLDVDTYSNGDPILYADSWEKAQEYYDKKKGCYIYWYDDEYHSDRACLGKLYNIWAINDPRGLAPAGFRVASFEDWDRLIDNLGGEVAARETLWHPDGFSAGDDDIYWTSTECELEYADRYIVKINNDCVRIGEQYNYEINSVRCIKI